MKFEDAIAKKRSMSKELLGSTRQMAVSFSLNEVRSFTDFHNLSNINGVALIPNDNNDFKIRIYTRQQLTRASVENIVLSHYELETEDIEIVNIGPVKAFPQVGNIRPAQPGYSIGHVNITAGTFGCLVRKNNNIYILSNNHVLANENNSKIGDAILQPGPMDRGTLANNLIANLTDFEPLKPGQNNTIDAAIAEPVDYQQVLALISHIGKVNGTVLPSADMAVQKSGRTSDLTNGIITALNVDIQVDYDHFTIQFVDQFEVTTNDGSAFSKPGDSGSLIVQTGSNAAVGLLFAGSSTITFANPIDPILNRFGVTIV